MAGRAAKGGKGQQARVSTEGLRATAGPLFAEGKSTADVAVSLGITERRARRIKEDLGSELRTAAATTIDGIVEGGNRARAVIVENAEAMAQTLVDAARGELPAGLTKAGRELVESGEEHPIETDPQSIGVRVKAAATALQFILATKIDANIKSDMTPETAAAVVAIAKAKAGA